MATQFPQLLAACAFALAATGVCASAAAAPESKHPKAEAVLKAKAKQQKAAPKKTAKAAAAAAGGELVGGGPGVRAYDAQQDDEPDITDTVTTEYACELNNKVTIYSNVNDSDHIALRWKKRVHRLQRIGTTTGARRFENPYWGLIWIGIPAKGILLDSRLNRQLANECKTAEQAEPVVAALPEEKKN